MKKRNDLIKAGILIVSLTMILQTIVTTAAEVNNKKISNNKTLNFEDTTPPNVKIEKPVKGVYFRDKKIFPRLIRLTLVIGSLTIEVNATDNETGVDRVEFYGGLRGTKYLGNDTTEPYNLTLKRDRIRFIHLQKIKVIAYDKAGNEASDKIIIRKIL